MDDGSTRVRNAADDFLASMRSRVWPIAGTLAELGIPEGLGRRRDGILLASLAIES